MCANYLPSSPDRLRSYFRVDPSPETFKPEIYPGYSAPIIRLAEDGSDEIESVPACFGMVPPWADLELARQTYNARTETVANKPSFRGAFRKNQFCIVPADAIFEPSYATGKAVRWKIAEAEGKPLGIAGIWDWRPHGGPDDRPLVSFSMLTINADRHPLMRSFHRPEDEKRMVVILEPGQYEAWLHASAANAAEFFRLYPAEGLNAQAAPKAPRTPHASPRQAGLLDDELGDSHAL